MLRKTAISRTNERKMVNENEWKGDEYLFYFRLFWRTWIQCELKPYRATFQTDELYYSRLRTWWLWKFTHTNTNGNQWKPHVYCFITNFNMFFEEILNQLYIFSKRRRPLTESMKSLVRNSSKNCWSKFVGWRERKKKAQNEHGKCCETINYEPKTLIEFVNRDETKSKHWTDGNGDENDGQFDEHFLIALTTARFTVNYVLLHFLLAFVVFVQFQWETGTLDLHLKRNFQVYFWCDVKRIKNVQAKRKKKKHEKLFDFMVILFVFLTITSSKNQIENQMYFILRDNSPE